jgi:geranylgeranyl pyrophosphate synthase
MVGQKTESLASLLSPYARRAEAVLARWLIEPGTPEALAEAMRYCVLGGGKRLRPGLVWMAAEAVGQDEPSEAADRAAVAVELIHGYSLVHDDLPALDNDVLRRGRPTAHVQFGEAMAILAGDALLTRAFGVLAEPAGARAGALAAELARGAGAAGMVAGQVADMDLCEVPAGLAGLRFVHLRKTAALIRAAARMGGICGGADDAQLDGLSRWAEALGLGFQLVDDVLDVTASAEQLGKTPGKDADTGKRSAVAELGLEEASRLCERLTRQAEQALQPLGAPAGKLRRLTHLLGARTH